MPASVTFYTRLGFRERGLIDLVVNGHPWLADIVALEISGHSTAARLIATLKSQLVRFQYRAIMLPGRSDHSFGEHHGIVEEVAAARRQRARRQVYAPVAFASTARQLGATTRIVRISR
jgi:FCD domain